MGLSNLYKVFYVSVSYRTTLLYELSSTCGKINHPKSIFEIVFCFSSGYQDTSRKIYIRENMYQWSCPLYLFSCVVKNMIKLSGVDAQCIVWISADKSVSNLKHSNFTNKVDVIIKVLQPHADSQKGKPDPSWIMDLSRTESTSKCTVFCSLARIAKRARD